MEGNTPCLHPAKRTEVFMSFGVAKKILGNRKALQEQFVRPALRGPSSEIVSSNTRLATAATRLANILQLYGVRLLSKNSRARNNVFAACEIVHSHIELLQRQGAIPTSAVAAAGSERSILVAARALVMVLSAASQIVASCAFSSAQQQKIYGWHNNIVDICVPDPTTVSQSSSAILRPAGLPNREDITSLPLSIKEQTVALDDSDEREIRLPLRVVVLVHPKTRPANTTALAAVRAVPESATHCHYPRDLASRCPNSSQPPEGAESSNFLLSSDWLSNAIVLFPAPDALSTRDLARHNHVAKAPTLPSAIGTLIVLEGTWPQAEAMLAHPRLVNIPRLSLSAEELSGYGRTAYWKDSRRGDNALSSIEALYIALEGYRREVAALENIDSELQRDRESRSCTPNGLARVLLSEFIQRHQRMVDFYAHTGLCIPPRLVAECGDRQGSSPSKSSSTDEV